MDNETDQATSNTYNEVDDTQEPHNQHLVQDQHLVQEAKKPYCQLCLKTFSSQKYLRRHQRTHAPKSNEHACDLCNKAYSRKDALKRHLLTHTEERPHVCDLCDEAFSRKDELGKHSLTHRPKSLHICYKCHKAFSREDSLKRHILTHTGTKGHVCRECRKCFTRKDELVKHFMVHEYPNSGAESNAREGLQTSNEIFPVENLKTRLIIHIKRKKPLRFADIPIKIEPEE